jgi:hypothetical protein
MGKADDAKKRKFVWSGLDVLYVSISHPHTGSFSARLKVTLSIPKGENVLFVMKVKLDRMFRCPILLFEYVVREMR